MALTHSQRKYVLIALNIFFIYGAFYLSNYGVTLGRVGNQGALCRYLTARGVYDQYAAVATMPKYNFPDIKGCTMLYSFDAWDR